MKTLAQKLAQQVDPDRLKKHILAMIKIPSPPCEEREVSEYYAGLLREIGMEVELDNEYPTSPNVIAYHKGASGGPTLQFDGHTDTIAAPAPEARGRDMKLRGWRSVGNISNFIGNAKIPGVYCGVSLATAHSDNERVSLQEAVEITRVYIHAIIEYLGVED